ncbi:MAG: nuclear transport factor 2 family protein [Acidimicrobiales bacterium]
MERTDLIAREAIRDLLARYTWAADRGRTTEVAACFTADGALDVGDHGGRLVGPEAIAHDLDDVVARTASSAASTEAETGTDGRSPVRHHVTSVAIALDTHAAATVRSYFLVLTRIGLDHWGRYRDQVVETAPGDQWLFRERVVIIDGRSPGSLMVPA